MKSEMINILVPVIGAVITFLSGLLMWLLNERSKRIHEEYKRKEEKYSELVKSLEGFYAHSKDVRKIDEFLYHLRLGWLYCSDEVIQKAYSFLSAVHADRRHSDEEKERAAAELMLAIRSDLIRRKPLKKTKLRPEDYKHLRANVNERCWTNDG